ncbi:MAG: hypothetical protein J7647_28855, partial [Cyanobacteria bacterium SBLK]|nr:hypothetical protein [Cyanobacteria bacterium SBLK]
VFAYFSQYVNKNSSTVKAKEERNQGASITLYLLLLFLRFRIVFRDFPLHSNKNSSAVKAKEERNQGASITLYLLLLFSRFRMFLLIFLNM